MTGGVEGGNKIRKLEWLLADAQTRGAKHVVTCGGIQSNHARATAVLASRLGMKATLLLRIDEGSTDPDKPAARERLPRTGNVLVDRLVGAEIRFLSHAEYKDRDACLAQVAARENAHVIPEGGSNGIGAFGYIDAMREVRGQLDLGLGGGPRGYDVIVHACGSGGTAAGTALGARASNVGARVMAVCVCDDGAYFKRVVDRITKEARAHEDVGEPVKIDFDEAASGPRYGVMDDDQRAFLVSVARSSGVVLDPVYTGKAFYGLMRAIERGAIAKNARVLFLHTGGLPGMLASGDAFEREL
jgi:D-cysteine desulfhydrase